MSSIQIFNDRGLHIVHHCQIVRVEAHSNYSKIYFTKGNPMMVAKVLQWFEVQLPEEMFSRIHRSHLVNKLFIEQICVAKCNTVLLSNGDKIAMSRRKKTILGQGKIKAI